MDLKGLGAININQDAFSASSSMEARIRDLQKAGPQTKKEKELMKAAKDMESFFMYLLLKEMRKTVPETKLISGGRGEEVFRDMLDEETTKQMAQSPGQSGFGIAQMLYEQLSRPVVMERIREEENPAAAIAAPPAAKEENK